MTDSWRPREDIYMLFGPWLVVGFRERYKMVIFLSGQIVGNAKASPVWVGAVCSEPVGFKGETFRPWDKKT